MSRYSIFGYYGHGNAGDEAILAALKNGIKDTIPSAIICAYSANPEETKSSHSIESYKFFSLDPISIIKGILGRRRRSYLSSLINFIKTDIIIVGGGGIFFDTPNENKWLFSYTNLIRTAKIFGKKVAVVGVSVGPLYNKESGKTLARALSSVDLISVRDETSRELLIQYNVNPEKIRIIPDLVFTLNSCDQARIQNILQQEKLNLVDRKIIALTPCCYNKNKAGWLDQYVSFCNRVTNELDAYVLLVPMQKNGTHNDYKATKEIFNSIDSKSKKYSFVLQGNYTAQEVQGILSSCDFVLAERLHGSIMAINTATPFMGIAYMPKVNGVLDLANLNDHVITMKDFLSGEHESNIIEFIKSSSGFSEKLAVSRSEARKKAHTNFNLINELALPYK